MRVETSAGTVWAFQNPDDPAFLDVHSYARAAVKIVADGVELLGGVEEAPEVRTDGLAKRLSLMHRVTVPRAAYARWLAFEAIEYVTYTAEEWRQ